MDAEHIKVALRVRPNLPDENQTPELLSLEGKKVKLLDERFTHEISPDESYGPLSSHADLIPFYKDAAIRSVKGYNTTIMAYGPSGTGKTYTMFGSAEALNGPPNPETDGVIQNTVSHIFQALSTKHATIYASFYSIHNEEIFDLLQSSGHPEINVRDTGAFGISTENLVRHIVTSNAEFRQLLQKGSSNLQAKRDAFGSSANTVLTLKIVHEKANKESQLKSCVVHLCDLASAEGLDSQDDPKLHASIQCLNQVLSALGDENAGEVPFSGSKLTSLLQGSIGNQSQTLLISTVSPCPEQAEQTLNTMKFTDTTREVMIQPAKTMITAYDMAPQFQRESTTLQELLHAKQSGQDIHQKLWELTYTDSPIEMNEIQPTIDLIEKMMIDIKDIRIALQNPDGDLSSLFDRSFVSLEVQEEGEIQAPVKKTPPPKAPTPVQEEPAVQEDSAVKEATPEPPASSFLTEAPTEDKPEEPVVEDQKPPEPVKEDPKPKEPVAAPKKATPPTKKELPKLLKDQDKSQLAQQLERQKLQEIQYAANELQSVMIFQGRCPVCTLVPPCRHYENASQFPKPMDPPEPRRPERLPSNPGITDIVPTHYANTARSASKPNRTQPDMGGLNKVRYRGKTVQTAHASIFQTEEASRIQSRRREQNRLLQKKLRDIERIEQYREEKLRKEIEKIEQEREEEEKRSKEQRMRDNKQRQHIEKQKEKLREWEDLKRREQNLKQIEKQKADKRNKRMASRRKRQMELQKFKIAEYREKRRLIDGIIRDQVRELETDTVRRTDFEANDSYEESDHGEQPGAEELVNES